METKTSFSKDTILCDLGLELLEGKINKTEEQTLLIPLI